MEQFKSKNKQHKEMKERKDFPSVRQDIINKIMGPPDEDDLCKGFSFIKFSQSISSGSS